MSERVITQSLLDFGNSFWSSSAAAQLYPGLPSERGFRPVGRFGIGFFSIFMYSDIAMVMSREFRSALDVWNVLSFEHGVHGRGNFFIGKTPDEIASADASTRVKIRVSYEFLWSLAEMDRRIAGTRAEEALLPEQEIISNIRELVCALDVGVQLSFLDKDPINLNDPLIYQKDLDVVWNFIGGDDSTLGENQKKMLFPLGIAPDQLYGYCGLNISQAGGATWKSVGGLVTRARFGRIEPIVGIAEYKVTAANREPGALAAPKDMIDIWVKEQIARVLREPLHEDQREQAAVHLGEMTADIRPIFFVSTSKGGLNLDEFITTLQKCKEAIFPVNRYESLGLYDFYYSLPRIGGEFGLQKSDIEFAEFAVCPNWSRHIDVHSDDAGRVHDDCVPGDYSDAWAVIFNTLRDLDIGFNLTFLKKHRIGKYVGLDSPRHQLNSGDDVFSDVLKVEIKRPTKSKRLS
jgi:hypothetical protein